MTWLLDANILLRLCEPRHRQHANTVRAVQTIQHADKCVLVPQSLYEFWVVATRPIEVNGLNLTPQEAHERMTGFVELFYLAKNELTIFDRWQQIVVEHCVWGVTGHDARYVAAMQRHGIYNFLTYNRNDFKRYSKITVATPDDIVNDLEKSR